MKALDDNERRKTLLHLLSKVDKVDSLSKFHSVIYCMKNEFDIFDDYRFDRNFLFRSDENLEDDLNILVTQRYANFNRTTNELIHEQATEISTHGKRYLRFFDVEEELRKKHGKNLENIENAFVGYNSMPIRDLISMQKA